MQENSRSGPDAGLTSPRQSDHTSILTSSTKLAGRFCELFRGSERAHGSFVPSAQQDRAKVEGQKRTNKGPLTIGDWESHLAGEIGAGAIPLLDDGTCVWGCVDIDVYQDLDPAKIAVILAQLHVPAIPCRSKSGGVHVLLFAREPVHAMHMVPRLREIANALGFPKAECFPKQVSPTECGGNWLNAPYFAGNETTRYAIKPNGDAVSPDDFLDLAESQKVAPEWFSSPVSLPRKPEPAAPKVNRKGFSLPDEIGEGQRDITLTSAAGKMRRAGFSGDEILAALRQMNQERCKPALADPDVIRIARSIGKKEPAPVDEDAGLTKGLATAITATDSFARDKGGLLYHFEAGVYRPTGERFIEKQVKALCEKWEKTKSWSPEQATRVCEWIRVDCPELWERPALDTLNCRNGLLDVATRALRSHSPDHLSAVQINASFDPQATCPAIDEFVRATFPDDSRHLSAEISGWLMLPDTSIQKALLLAGEGSNGKSVWLNLLLTFLGHENVSTISLHRLESDKFSAARLVGKLANIGTDLPTSALAGTSVFKALTGGDVITAERKYESSFEFRPFARLLFSANSAPRSEDSTHGFFRRWLVIPFNRTFDEKDPNTIPRAVLDAQLSQPGELSGLLNRALDALPTIRSGRFTESDSTRAALAEFRATTDPLAVWLDLNTVERPDAMVPKDRLRSMYGQVCEEAGRPRMPEGHFTAALKRLRPKVEPARRRVDGKQVQVFVGLGLVTREPDPSGLF